jgi:hypothetical protein
MTVWQFALLAIPPQTLRVLLCGAVLPLEKEKDDAIYWTEEICSRQKPYCSRAQFLQSSHTLGGHHVFLEHA